MKYHQLKFGLLLFIFIVSCSKFSDLKDNDPTRNPSYLYGRLFLNDVLTQNSRNVPLANKTVTVAFSDATDTLNYIYNTTTNAEGYFQFPELNKSREYTVRYQENLNGHLVFAKADRLTLPQDSVKLVAGVLLNGQTGLIITVNDGQGRPVTNADACIASSIIPYNNNTCEGSSYSLKSDVNGHASQFNMEAGQYYVVAKIAINGTSYAAKAPLNVVNNKVAQLTLQLTGPSSAVNTINFVLVDVHKNPVNNGQICLFTSKSLFQRDTCEGSNHSLVTDPLGRASISNLSARKYYVLGQLALTKFKLLARDSVTAGSGTIQDTLILK